MTLDMSLRFPISDEPDIPPCDGKLAGEFCFGGAYPRANGDDILLSQFGVVVPTAARHTIRMSARTIIVAARSVVTTLRDAIQSVVQIRAKPQMGRVTAYSVVAGMQHSDSVLPFSCAGKARKRHPVVQLIRHAGCYLVVALPLNAAISRHRWPKLPRPAFVWGPYVYLGPEALSSVPSHA